MIFVLTIRDTKKSAIHRESTVATIADVIVPVVLIFIIRTNKGTIEILRHARYAPNHKTDGRPVKIVSILIDRVTSSSIHVIEVLTNDIAMRVVFIFILRFRIVIQ